MLQFSLHENLTKVSLSYKKSDMEATKGQLHRQTTE